jgi:hypothetical protein
MMFFPLRMTTTLEKLCLTMSISGQSLVAMPLQLAGLQRPPMDELKLFLHVIRIRSHQMHQHAESAGQPANELVVYSR